MHQEPGLEQSLQQIRERFEATLPQRAEEVGRLWQQLCLGWDDSLAKSLYTEIHRMYGTCGSLGFGPISEIACEIHTYLESAMEQHALPDAAITARVGELVCLLTSHCKPCVPAAEAEPIRVLVVEDDLELASVYSAILREAGMAIQVVGPQHAAEEGRKMKPDLILLDLTTPTCRRFELAGALRELPCFATLPLICLSVEDQPAHLVPDRTDWLSKPVDPELLIRLIRRRVEQQR